MGKSVCFYFQVHQPDRLRQFRFFDIGNDYHYLDDFANRTIVRRIADRCYLPMNDLLLDLIRQHKGAFRVAFSISGVAIEQFQKYTPDVIDKFKDICNKYKDDSRSIYEECRAIYQKSVKHYDMVIAVLACIESGKSPTDTIAEFIEEMKADVEVADKSVEAALKSYNQVMKNHE